MSLYVRTENNYKKGIHPKNYKNVYAILKEIERKLENDEYSIESYNKLYSRIVIKDNDLAVELIEESESLSPIIFERINFSNVKIHISNTLDIKILVFRYQWMFKLYKFFTISMYQFLLEAIIVFLMCFLIYLIYV